MREFSEFKVINHLGRVRAVLRGEFPPPITLEIDPTNACNHSCVWCIDRQHREKNGAASLPLEVAKRAVAEAREMGALSLVIKGGGEPLVYPHIAELMRFAKGIGFELGVITNGERIVDHADVLRKTCSWLRISLDAGSAETHRQAHRPTNPDAYERVWKGIDLLAGDVYCGVIYIIHPLTFHEMAVAARRAKESGCQYIGFKRVVADEEIFDAEMYMSIDTNYLFAKRHYEDADFHVMGFRIYNYSQGPRGREYNLCLGHHLVGILCADGGVYACCSTRGMKPFCFGNVYEQSFAEIWHGERRREILKRINDKKCRRICVGHTSYMRYDHYNNLFEYLADEEKPHGNFL
ncbi:MAG: radical SAM protein [Candidatus Lernaella stagnicola]|nr:radical SAM protein [Candidatus Lernaella stagnicola]